MASSSSPPHVSTARQPLRIPGERANGAASLAAALGVPRREARVALRAHARRIEAVTWKAAGAEARRSIGGGMSRRGDSAVCAAAGQVAGRSAGMEVALATAAVVAMGTGNRVLYKLALVPLRQYPFFLAQFATFGYTPPPPSSAPPFSH